MIFFEIWCLIDEHVTSRELNIKLLAMGCSCKIKRKIPILLDLLALSWAKFIHIEEFSKMSYFCMIYTLAFVKELI